MAHQTILFLRFTILILFVGLALASCSGTRADAGPPTLTPLEVRGQAVFEAVCVVCHSTIEDSVIVGPSLAGIGTRAGERVEGTDAETYIRESILDPTAYTVEGFPEKGMPANLAQELSQEDIDAVVAYLLTLRE